MSAQIIAPTLENIYNKSLQQNAILKSLKLVNFIPLYKSGSKISAATIDHISS